MEKRTIISSAQLLSLALGSALVLPYTYLPVLTTPPANQDVWMVPIIAIVYKIILAMPLLFLVSRFKGMGVNDIFEIIMGKFMGKVLALLVVIFFIFLNVIFVTMSILFINASVFPETPSWAVLLYMIIPIMYVTSKGAGTVARLSTFLVPYIILTIIAFLVMSIKDLDLFILKPIFVDSGFIELNKGAFLNANTMTEIYIFLIFSVHVKKDTKFSSIFSLFLILFTISITLVVIPTVTMLGMDIAKHAENPYFLFTRQVGAYDFIQRLESFNVLGWYVGILLRVSIYNYMASTLISGIIKSKITCKQFSIPVAIVVAVLTMIPQINQYTTSAFLRSNKIYPWVTLVVTFIIPIIIVIVYFIRKNKIKEIIKQNEKKVQH